MFFRAVLKDAVNVQKVYSELKTDSLYNQSVKLFAGALLKQEDYANNLKVIEKTLEASEDSSFKAWMTGRVVLAALHVNDQKSANKHLVQLKTLLDKDIPKDECYAWALGYIAAAGPEEYKNYKDKMTTVASTLTKPTDALWAHVMNLQAAARAQDHVKFDAILQQMKTFTKKETVVEALAEIAVNDWQAWAVGITAEAAATIRNERLYLELQEPLEKAIALAGNTANGMLAQISLEKASEIMQREIALKAKVF